MSRIARLAVVLAVGIPALFQVAHACGDKFLMVGRGTKFQRVYASVYPGRVLIYTRPETAGKAAIRDPQLHKALRQAGHSVSVVDDWTLLEQALRNVPVDVVLVDIIEAEKLQVALSQSHTNPEPLYVASAGTSGATKQTKLKASDRPVRFLDEVENVMKARARAKSAKS